MKSPHTSLEFKHTPVMLKEVIEICSPKKGNSFVDCTLGGGSYSKSLLSFPSTKVTAFDRDPEVIGIANKIKKKFKKRFNFYHNKFSNLDQISTESIDAVIFDLGISSIQLDNLKRGFSFKSKFDLDMNMGLSSISASEVINNFDEKILKNIFKYLGEEKDASKIAKNISIKRSIKKIKTTEELVEIIKQSKKQSFKKKIDVCTKTFQALRIFINKEITELISGIIKATKVLKPGGKLIVVTFHSLEDRIVKFYFKNYSSSKSNQNKYLPNLNNNNFDLFEKYKNRIITASNDEIKKNPRSRSAKLRFAVRNKNKFSNPKELKLKFNYLIKLEGDNA